MLISSGRGAVSFSEKLGFHGKRQYPIAVTGVIALGKTPRLASFLPDLDGR
jgi:hypothetical protein